MIELRGDAEGDEKVEEPLQVVLGRGHSTTWALLVHRDGIDTNGVRSAQLEIYCSTRMLAPSL